MWRAREHPGRYLLLEDTSESRCAGAQELVGLGPVGTSKEAKRGFHLQSVLAVRWPPGTDTPAPNRAVVAILGLAEQQYHVRQPRPAGSPRHGSARRGRKADDLESALWEQAAQRLGPAPEGEAVVWGKGECERGGDSYAHLCHCQPQHQRFVSRASQDRVVVMS